MATLDPICVDCPACGETITVPVSAAPGDRREDGSIEVHVGLDHEPIREHADQHRERVLLELRRRYGWTREQASSVPAYLLPLLFDTEQQ